jgi:hypothetical protein
MCCCEPPINMGISKQKKMDGYEDIPSMNDFGFMEIDDHVDFSYLNCFVAFHKHKYNKRYIVQPFMYAL